MRLSVQLAAAALIASVTGCGQSRSNAVDAKPHAAVASGDPATHRADRLGIGFDLKEKLNDVAMQANGYPSPGSRNYRPPRSERMDGDDEAHVDPAPDPRPPGDPTRPTTDLSAYR